MLDWSGVGVGWGGGAGSVCCYISDIERGTGVSSCVGLEGGTGGGRGGCLSVFLDKATWRGLQGSHHVVLEVGKGWGRGGGGGLVAILERGLSVSMGGGGRRCWEGQRGDGWSNDVFQSRVVCERGRQDTGQVLRCLLCDGKREGSMEA